jgi:hypothetical protein
VKNNSSFHRQPRQARALSRREFLWQSGGGVGGIALAGLLAVTGSHAADKKETATPTVYATCNLVETIATWQQQPLKAGEILRLEPEWVGTVRRTYFRDRDEISKQGVPEDIRFSHLQSTRARPGEPPGLEICRGRQTEGGHLSYHSVEIARFRSDLPKAEAIAKATRFSELEPIIGRRHIGRHVGCWMFFGKEANDRLWFMRIYVYSPLLRGMKDDTIESIEIQEGTFRPANPNSEEERRRFKSADTIDNEWRAAQAAKDAKLPQPLRALVEARHPRDDSDLVAYTRALEAIRKNPDPLLFQQLVERIDEDSVTIGGYLGHILLKDNFAMKLAAWQEPERLKALRATVDATPRVKTWAGLEDVVTTILLAQGGAKMHFDIPTVGVTVRLECERRTDGVTKTYDSMGITQANLPVVVEECRKWLMKRYPELSKP